ncbi:MAG: Cell division protein FtsK [Myxococcales bacterium]|nr:Cell division protein FtsK [Myxococcales bacterium]
MTRARRLAVLLTLVSIPVGPLAATAARAGEIGRFARDLDSRKTRFAREGARPQAVVPLLGAITDLWDVLDDRAPLARFLEEAATSKTARADVKARAVWLRSLVLDRMGQPKAAEAERARLGLLTQFWVAGPFDNEGRTGHAAKFAPETQLVGAIDPSVKLDGKERAVQWRLMPAIAQQGMVSLDAMLRPDTNVTAYLTTMVRVPAATKAAVRVGSAGAVKVWVDGALAVDRDVYRAVRFDQDAAPVELRAGWNRVTVKLSTLDSAWSLFVRLTAPDGTPLDGLLSSTELAKFAESKPGRRAHHAVADLRRDLEAWAKSHPRDPQAWSDAGQLLLHVAPDDPEQHRAADAFARAAKLQPSPENYRQLALAQIDPNDKRRALEEGLSVEVARRAPKADQAPLYELLGELYHRSRRERRAEELWLDGRAADPTYWPIAMRLAELASERGVPSRAATMLAQLETEHAPLKVLRAEAQLAVRRGRRADAQKMYARVADAERDDTDALRELFSFARAEGASKQALELVDRIARARPDVLQCALDRADVFESMGKGGDAHEALKVALEVSPDETRLLERDGRLLHRLGRDEEALGQLKRALELKPQNPELRAYLLALQPKERGSDLARGWSVDVPSLIKRAPKLGATRDRARVLYDSQVTRVHPNGLSEAFQQRVVEILDERGAREEGQVDIRYTPDTQAVEVRAARVYKRSGEVIEATSSAERDVSEPWYGLYYDVKAQIIDFDALEAGDVIDVEYVISDTARRNMFADYFGDLHVLQEDLPRVESRYVLIAPKSKTLYFNKPRLAGVTHESETRGADTIHTFHAANVAKVDAEPGMPGFTDVAAYVHVSTYKTWEDVAQWYRGLVMEQLHTSPAIHDAVMEAVKGLTDERARIRAVYDLVVRKTRYVGLEFGIHGYQPYRTTQVFARKFGDCKDKASLLVVMLREIGVESSLVLARTRRGGDLDAEPASLAPFDHAIVWVPKLDLFLDGTAEFSGADELPAQDQDIPVLIVRDGKLRRTPVLAANRNRVITDQAVKLDAGGGARVEEHVTVSGEVAHEWRYHYQSPGERLERYGKAWSQKHPGARVESVDMPTLPDLERPVEVRAGIDVPDWGRVEAASDGGELVLPALGREADMLRSYARLSSRKYDLVLGFPWRQEDRVTVTLPAGMTVKRLPEARTVEAPFGRFTLAAQHKGGAVVVEASLQVDRHRIAREDYGAFRKFCADVDAAIGQELVLGK